VGLTVFGETEISGRDDWIRTSGPLLPNPTHSGRWRGAGLIPSWIVKKLLARWWEIKKRIPFGGTLLLCNPRSPREIVIFDRRRSSFGFFKRQNRSRILAFLKRKIWASALSYWRWQAIQSISVGPEEDQRVGYDPFGIELVRNIWGRKVRDERGAYVPKHRKPRPVRQSGFSRNAGYKGALCEENSFTPLTTALFGPPLVGGSLSVPDSRESSESSFIFEYSIEWLTIRLNTCIDM